MSKLWPVLIVVALAGCVTVAGTQGIHHTFSNVVYKSFSANHDDTYSTLLKVLDNMGIKTSGTKPTLKGSEVTAFTPDLRVEVKLRRLTETVTKVSINAKRSVFSKEPSLAVEILTRMGQILER